MIMSNKWDVDTPTSSTVVPVGPNMAAVLPARASCESSPAAPGAPCLIKVLLPPSEPPTNQPTPRVAMFRYVLC